MTGVRPLGIHNVAKGDSGPAVDVEVGGAETVVEADAEVAEVKLNAGPKIDPDPELTSGKALCVWGLTCGLACGAGGIPLDGCGGGTGGSDANTGGRGPGAGICGGGKNGEEAWPPNGPKLLGPAANAAIAAEGAAAQGGRDGAPEGGEGTLDWGEGDDADCCACTWVAIVGAGMAACDCGAEAAGEAAEEIAGCCDTGGTPAGGSGAAGGGCAARVCNVTNCWDIVANWDVRAVRVCTKCAFCWVKSAFCCWCEMSWLAIHCESMDGDDEDKEEEDDDDPGVDSESEEGSREGAVGDGRLCSAKGWGSPSGSSSASDTMVTVAEGWGVESPEGVVPLLRVRRMWGAQSRRVTAEVKRERAKEGEKKREKSSAQRDGEVRGTTADEEWGVAEEGETWKVMEVARGKVWVHGARRSRASPT
jgi:hypothetical protein